MGTSGTAPTAPRTTGVTGVAGGAVRLDVDTAALLAAGRALASAAQAAHTARGAAAGATTGAGWAVDGPLPDALDRFAATVGATLGRLVDDAREAAAALDLAATRYAAAERAAAGVGGRTPGAVAWRDASVAPGG